MHGLMFMRFSVSGAFHFWKLSTASASASFSALIRASEARHARKKQNRTWRTSDRMHLSSGVCTRPCWPCVALNTPVDLENPSDFSVWVSKQKKKHMNDLRQWLQKRQIVPRTLWPSEDHNQPAHKSSIPLHQPGHGLYRSESTGEFQEESTSISSQRPKGSTKTYLEI